MKTTFDLPDALVRQLELRAEQRGLELKEAVTELLWTGLAAMPETSNAISSAVLKTHPTTGLPYVECGRRASPAEEMTPLRAAELMLEQETTWHHEAGR